LSTVRLRLLRPLLFYSISPFVVLFCPALLSLPLFQTAPLAIAVWHLVTLSFSSPPFRPAPGGLCVGEVFLELSLRWVSVYRLQPDLDEDPDALPGVVFVCLLLFEFSRFTYDYCSAYPTFLAIQVRHYVLKSFSFLFHSFPPLLHFPFTSVKSAPASP